VWPRSQIRYGFRPEGCDALVHTGHDMGWEPRIRTARPISGNGMSAALTMY